MATRRSIAPKPVDTESLEVLVQQYAEMKERLDPLKKSVDKCGTEIKTQMVAGELSEYTVGDIRVSVTVTPKEDFNELQAIEILREELTPEQFEKVVKTREYIDDDALEALSYNHEVDPAILKPCITPKEPTVTLRLGKAKK